MEEIQTRERGSAFLFFFPFSKCQQKIKVTYTLHTAGVFRLPPCLISTARSDRERLNSGRQVQNNYPLTDCVHLNVIHQLPTHNRQSLLQSTLIQIAKLPFILSSFSSLHHLYRRRSILLVFLCIVATVLKVGWSVGRSVVSNPITRRNESAFS